MLDVLAFLQTTSTPGKRESEQLVLQAAVVAHDEATALLEVVEHEVGLAGLQHRANEATSPVHKELAAVHEWELGCEATQRIQVGKHRLLLVCVVVLVTYLEIFVFLEVLGHILEPAHDGDGIRLVACIDKVLAQVLCGIVGQETTSHHGVRSLLIANLYRTRSFLVFADSNFQFVVAVGEHHLGFARLGVHVALLIRPELTVVDGTILQEGNLPITSLIVAPIRGEELFPALLDRFDAFDLEGAPAVALNEVEHLRALRQRWEVKGHLALATLVHKGVFVELDVVSRDDGVTLVSHFQISVANKLEPLAKLFRIRTFPGSDIDHRLVVLQLHLLHIEQQVKESVAIACSILSSGLFPHRYILFCPARHYEEGKKHS